MSLHINQTLEECLITMFSKLSNLETGHVDDLYTEMTFKKKPNLTYEINLWSNNDINRENKFTNLLNNYTYKKLYRCCGTWTEMTYEYGHTNNIKNIKKVNNCIHHDRSWHFVNQPLNLVKIINALKDNKNTIIHTEKDYVSIVWTWEPTLQKE